MSAGVRACGCAGGPASTFAFVSVYVYVHNSSRPEITSKIQSSPSKPTAESTQEGMVDDPPFTSRHQKDAERKREATIGTAQH